jgi:hypothetical protein
MTTDPAPFPTGQEVMMIDVDWRNPSSTTSASRRFPRTKTWPSSSSAAPSPTY